MKNVFTVITLMFLTLANQAYAIDSIKEVSIKEVQQYVQTKPANVVILDANNEDARKSAGTIPGAILLSSYNQYSLSELPKDKNSTLVFYCYNSYCQASHAAAERALTAGYKNATVLKAGIDGWNKSNAASSAH
jgi:rhodanese-related sulfurtransferase